MPNGSSYFEQQNAKYNRMGDLLKSDDNPLATAGDSNWDEAYTYDVLNRLSTFARGIITSSTLTTTKFGQSWMLDALGNFTAFSPTTTRRLPAD